MFAAGRWLSHREPDIARRSADRRIGTSTWTATGIPLEDRIVTAAGSYSAAAPLFGNYWVMQFLVLRGMAP